MPSLSRIWQHMRSLWPRWTLLPIAPFWAWFAYCFARGERRWEHLILAIFIPAIAYGNERTKKVYRGLLPIGCVGLLYESMRFVKNVGLDASRIHLCDLRAIEMRLFGVTSGGVRMTWNDFFQLHWSTAADLYCAIPYGLFLFVPMGFVVWLYRRDFPAALRFGWTFFLLNVAAFVTYHLYPAAPPWYFHDHGCVVDVAARASEGPALARVDQILGFHYFGGLYGRSNDTFGAVPSLHVAYPFLMVIEGWKKTRVPGKSALVVYWLSTCFAAVYLDHHWVFDVVLGTAYTLLVYLPTRRVLSLGDDAIEASTRISVPSLPSDTPAPSPVLLAHEPAPASRDAE